ncbi:hypothetical protein Bphyt_2944 [Paraburkholderia phytofirmans PsJN]|uniref:Uncharacterized protein n=1 Tax=Paraburkholderia phytofirmans (strain DSM 17436 / LMG 22146 / PsJN) TaxID=398527 RepID=B2T5X4_PARPJ|nr:hypothetical protein Bphyt_2944 [Paraburkholderia phytofirmans PsJN]
MGFGVGVRVRESTPEHGILPFAVNCSCVDGCACNQARIVLPGLGDGVTSVAACAAG